MRILIITLSCIIAVLAVVPYQLDVINGKSKPRVASWLVWAILAGVAGTAALSDHQIPAGVFAISNSVEDFVVVLLGLKLGNRTFERLDVFSLMAAIVGIWLLVVLKLPAITLLVVIATDIFGTIPTIKHAWFRPYDETLYTFLMFVVADWLILLIAHAGVFTSYAWPAYLFIADAMVAFLILFSPNWKDVAELMPEKKFRTKLGLSKPLLSKAKHYVGQLNIAAPTGLRFSLTDRLPLLEWQAVNGATSYSVYRDGVPIGTCKGTIYADSQITEKKHSYYVTAVGATSQSKPSNSVHAVMG
jgi:hypothetical protein